MFKAEGMFRSGWPSKLIFCFCFFAECLFFNRNKVGPSQRSRLDGCHESRLALVVPVWAQNIVLKTPLGSLSWDPLSVRRARAVAPLGESRIPPRCFAVSNKNVLRQGIRLGTVSELNKSEADGREVDPEKHACLLQNSTPVWATGKKHGRTSSQNQSNTKERLRSILQNQRRYYHQKTDVFGGNERCCSGTLKLESYCFVSLSKEFEVAPFLNSTSRSLMWRSCSAKSRLSAEPEKTARINNPILKNAASLKTRCGAFTLKSNE